jgi:uncharacterized protein (TIGR03435 family)
VRVRTTFALVALVMPLQVPPARSQAPAFEAASIKPTHDTPGSTSGITSTPGRITGRNVTLKRCIRGAYDIPETLILSGPKWIDEDRYDIEAVASGPASDHEMMVMLQSLLADRFQLKFHREQKDMSGYALVVTSGLRVERSPDDTPATTSASRGRLEARASTMANLAQKLSDALKVPVVDFTRLEGRFNFTLSWDPTEVNPSAPASTSTSSARSSGPSVFTAVQEQLGLKLESRKVPVDVLVIDAASKPSVN